MVQRRKQRNRYFREDGRWLMVTIAEGKYNCVTIY